MSHVLSPEEGKDRQEEPPPATRPGEKGKAVTINNDYSSNVVTVICRPTSSAPTDTKEAKSGEARADIRLKRNSTVSGHMQQCDLCRDQGKQIEGKL